MGRVALIMDGGYVIKRFEGENRPFPSVANIQQLAGFLMEGIRDGTLYRVLFYNADPYRGSEPRPLGGAKIQFADTKTARNNERLMHGLEESDDFAVRRGELVFRGWRLSSNALEALRNQPGKTVSGTDFIYGKRVWTCGWGWTSPRWR